MEIDDDTLRSAFAGFRGVKRRFTKTGEAGGITVIDDYGHHPVEIAAVLKAARQAGARDVVAVVQPHRYTRLAFAVRRVLHLHERRRHGDRRRRLCGRRGADRRRDSRRAGRGLRARGHRSVVPLPSPERLAEMVYAIARPAISSSAWAPATSRNGPRRCRAQLAALQAGAVAGCRTTGRRAMMAGGTRVHRICSSACRRCAAASQADAPLGPVHLVPRRRPRRGAGAPRRCR